MEFNGENTFDALFERSLAILVREYGFEKIELTAYHQLLDLSNSILRRLLLNIKHLMEVQLRTEPCPTDLARALQLMNVKSSLVQQTFNQPIKTRLNSPDRQNEIHSQKLFRVTQAANNATRKPRPIYIPDFLPEFPDPHTFISSETYADIRKDYPRVRQLLADQRRSLQRSLVKFKLQTNEKLPVVVNHAANTNDYYLIKSTLSPLPYLSALLPQDQIDSDNTEAMDDDTIAGNRSARTQSLSTTEDVDM
jgi:transcription initiation factor TFIID subunit 8